MRTARRLTRASRSSDCRGGPPPSRAVAASPAPAGTPASGDVPGLVLFFPRHGRRRLLTGLLVATGAAAALAAYAAWQAPSATTLALAGGLTVLAVLVSDARDRATDTAVTVEDGLLTIAEGGTLHRFPLTGRSPSIDVHGTPGRWGWKVLIERRGQPPYVLNRRMVDPVEFTEVLRRFRPTS